jgi:hypothetical protein
VFFTIPAESGKELERTVTVRCLDSRPFMIRAVRTTDPRIGCKATLNAAAARQELAIVIDLMGTRGTIDADLIIETDEPSQAKVEIPITVLDRQIKVP